jgi:hypothetical protein
LVSVESIPEPIADERLDVSDLGGAVVVAAEDAVAYFGALPVNTVVGDLVSVLSPPFEKLWIEAQGLLAQGTTGIATPARMGMTAWGVLIEGFRSDKVAPTDAAWNLDELGWVLSCSVVGEWRKGRPVGPLAHYFVALGQDGCWSSSGDAFMGKVPELKCPPPFGAYSVKEKEVQRRLADQLGAPLVGPALFAISLMHCKNVTACEIAPPEKLSAKHQRKTGRPLVKYYVLDIEPMRRILDRDGEAQTKGLRHALHICRGHFKSYTEDSPLFGRHTGTYWWAAQARGSAGEGVIEKDYRIRLDQGLGREYVRADEHPEITPHAPEHTGLDPDLGGRGLQAHNVTQNLLASAVEQAGYAPRRPKPDEPQYDLAWEVGEVVWVAEVKSITLHNEERQLRLALGQVVRYRQLLAAEGRAVRAMIAVEHEPRDPTWVDLCGQEEITLAWPGNMNVAESSL